jgi:hypothetical protein
MLATVLSALALGALPVGAPATPVAPVKPDPHAGIGAPVAATARLLGVTAPDPSGGPGWGLRYVETTRGLACVQAARVQDGQLGAIGQDGAFGDDGRFHPIPADVFDLLSACAPIEADGHAYAGTVATGIGAAAKPGGSCEARQFVRGDTDGLRLCPVDHVRNVYFGTLGPQARSVTYTLADGPHTVPTVGPEGAYLIVLDDRQSRDFNGVMSALVPMNSPITALAFADGTTCAVTERGGTCPIPGRRPPKLAPLPAGGVHAPVHARATRNGGTRPRFTTRVSFRAPVAIDSPYVAYEVTLRRRGARQYAVAPVDRDVAAGHVVTVTFREQRAGRFTGVVQLVRTNPDEAARPRFRRDRVGSFTLRVS